MFERGSLWKPPPLKNLRSKVLPPMEGEIVKKGQLSTKLEIFVNPRLSYIGGLITVVSLCLLLL